MYMQQNQVETHDSWWLQFKIIAEGWKGSFVNINNAISKIGQVHRRTDKWFYELELQKSTSYMTYLRDVYGVWSIISDLGGVLAVLISVFSVILDPININLFMTNYM